jgi:hypothetical protein
MSLPSNKYAIFLRIIGLIIRYIRYLIRSIHPTIFISNYIFDSFYPNPNEVRSVLQTGSILQIGSIVQTRSIVQTGSIVRTGSIVQTVSIVQTGSID